MSELSHNVPKITLKKRTCPVCKGTCHVPLSDDPVFIGTAPCSQCRGTGMVSVLEGSDRDVEHEDLGMATASAIAEVSWGSKSDYEWSLRMLCEPVIKENTPLRLYEAPSSSETYIAVPANMIKDYKRLIETSNLGEEGRRARLEKLSRDAFAFPPDQGI